MGVQVKIQTRDPSSGSGYRKLHGPTRPKGQGHMKDPYLGFPNHRHPWEGSVAAGLKAFVRWLETKPALERDADRIHVHAVRRPDDVRGRRAQRRAEEYTGEGS